MPKMFQPNIDSVQAELENWNCVDCSDYREKPGKMNYCKAGGELRFIPRYIDVKKTHPAWCPLEG